MAHLSLNVLAAAKVPEIQPVEELLEALLLEELLDELLLDDPDGEPYEPPPPPPPPQADKTATAAIAMQIWTIFDMVSPA